MTRRLFLMAPCVPVVKPAEKIPTEPYQINPFCDQMNRYIELRQRGEVSIKQWERVVRAWRRMTE